MANLFDDANAPETEPAAIVAGDQVKWKRTDLGTDYPPGHVGAAAGGSKKSLIFQRDTAFQLALRWYRLESCQAEEGGHRDGAEVEMGCALQRGQPHAC